MGNKTFIFDINAIGKLSPLFALSGPISPMLSALSSSSNINLEIGDEVIVAALKEKNTGLYRVEALKNLSKDYCSSHIKHDGTYILLLMLFSFVLFWSFAFGLILHIGDKNSSILMISIFIVLPLFSSGDSLP